MTTEIGHWINGKLVAGKSGRFTDVFNPATGEVQARVALATKAELDAIRKEVDAWLTSKSSAQLAREHNDANVIAMGARLIGIEMAKACVMTFINSNFDGDRHQRVRGERRRHGAHTASSTRNAL